MDIIRDTNINWLKYRWHFIGFSLLVIALGALDMVRKGGPRYGIDFSEGTIVYAKFEKTPQIDAVREKLGSAGRERVDDLAQRPQPAALGEVRNREQHRP